MAAPIPVTVLTGFLGSGKTTVLNNLLRQPELDGAVVIVNEFGEIGLDHLLIAVSEEQFALLDNGCVCCTVRGDLVATLKDIDRRSSAGEIPVLRHVLIETTGLADPAPIIHTLITEPDLAQKFRVGQIVTLVDAVNGAATIARHSEAAKQIAVADRILISKIDLAAEAALATLQQRIAVLAPMARRSIVHNGAVAAAEIIDRGALAEIDAPSELAAWFERAARAADIAADAHHHGDGCDVCGADHDHHHHHHEHQHHGIQSYSFIIDQPIEWPAFAQWLDYVAAIKGEDLLRLKGLVHVAEDQQHPLVIHGVQHVFHPPVRLEAWPSADRRTRLVFIVRDIPRETIARTLTKFAAIDAARIARPAAEPAMG